MLEIVMTRSIETNRDWRQHWSTIVTRVGSQELLRQVERTIAGVPMDDVQIDLCIESIRAALGLKSTDTLLDLCCGNGLITKRLSADCSHIIGVDISRDLIDVARHNHAVDNITYVYGPATEISTTALGGFVPSKIVMCGGLQYFVEAGLRELMAKIDALSAQNVPIFFTDVPDVDRLYEFYDTPERQAEFARRRAAGTEAIGTWWSKEHLSGILEHHKYTAVFKAQDPRRFGAHYRFDLLGQPQ
jgi:cyclopropane fatty-acyl-phospholipid synthase-like methyltransferase